MDVDAVATAGDAPQEKTASAKKSFLQKFRKVSRPIFHDIFLSDSSSSCSPYFYHVSLGYLGETKSKKKK